MKESVNGNESLHIEFILAINFFNGIFSILLNHSASIKYTQTHTNICLIYLFLHTHTSIQKETVYMINNEKMQSKTGKKSINH